MHYNVGKEKDILIKSEYAAKSMRQQSGWVIDWINGLPKDKVVLDYGCGKLRYTIPLFQRVKEVIATDSSYQVNRIQKIDGEHLSNLREYQKNVNNLKVCTVEEFDYSGYFDYALCTNVLSAIPYESERINVLRRIYKSLKRDGKALITTQYRNSYFKFYETRDNARRFNDGWLINSRKGYSFYGIITPKSLKELSIKADINVKECSSIGESAYIILEKL